MLSPRILHDLGDLGPLMPILFDKLEESDIFFRGPPVPFDSRIEVVIPLLPTMVQIPEYLAVGLGEDPVGNPPPIDSITASPLLCIIFHHSLKIFGLLFGPRAHLGVLAGI